MQVVESARRCMLAICESITGIDTLSVKAMSPLGLALSVEQLISQFFVHAFNHCLDESNTCHSRWMLFAVTQLAPILETQNWIKLKEAVVHIEDALNQKTIGQATISCVDVIIWSYLYSISQNTDVLLTMDTPLVKKWVEAELEWTLICKKIVNPQDITNRLERISITDYQFESSKNGFIKEDKRILITSALPYVNNVPHLGNLIGAILSADVFARFARKCYKHSLFICGSDEYGTTTETKAIEERCTPKEICDKYHALHKSIYDWFEISFDHYGRTSTEHQTRIAQDIFKDLNDNGYIFSNTVDQPYCTKCQRFLADRYVEGICPLCGFDDARGDQCDKCGKLLNAVDLKNPKCKLCGALPVCKSSDQLFLDLPKLEPEVSKWFQNAISTGHWTQTAKSITENWLNEGIKARCITRDMKWGTPVPLKGFTDKVFYVWFDAPIGYLSITADHTSNWRDWWMNSDQVELYQFMAKDNVPFHSIVFPCSLLGTRKKYTMVQNLIAIEYLNFENEKFSKSRNVGVFCDQAMSMDIDCELWRYYLVSIRPETQDGNFAWDDFQLRCNSELLNNLGNFVNRSLSFCNKFFNSEVPPISDLGDDVHQFCGAITSELRQLKGSMEQAQLRDGLRHVMAISKRGNQLLQTHKPWDLIKDPAKWQQAANIINVSVNLVVLLGIIAQPFMPSVSRRIFSQCNLNETDIADGWPIQFTMIISGSHRINTAVPLFTRFTRKQM